MKTIELSNRVRRSVVEMVNRGKSSHVGSGLSIVDILSVLYGRVLNVDPRDPAKPDRDRFILSKGHAGAAVYAVLAHSGFFPVEKLETHYQDGSDLSGHVTHKGNPGVEFSTGSLGHGLGVGVGMALALKMENRPGRVFVLLSDGECDEGSNWEAILFAAHHRLDNLTAIVDYNKIQSLAPISETLGLEPFTEKWAAFNWGTEEVDGHDHDSLYEAFQKLPMTESRPSVIIAHTIKGKGVSFMENQVLWHYRTPQNDEFDRAIQELEQST